MSNNWKHLYAMLMIENCWWIEFSLHVCACAWPVCWFYEYLNVWEYTGGSGTWPRSLCYSHLTPATVLSCPLCADIVVVLQSRNTMVLSSSLSVSVLYSLILFQAFKADKVWLQARMKKGALFFTLYIYIVKYVESGLRSV